MIPLDYKAIQVQKIEADWLSEKNIQLDVLRLDKMHEVVSGNKAFKLKYYLADAINKNKTTIATFGGAWSNHIVATAYACKAAELQSVGIIRGEQTSSLTATLKDAIHYGMQLKFINRSQYREKEIIKEQFKENNWYWINEGGYGELGAKGAEDILAAKDIFKHTHIIAGVGTGTMLAGLINGSHSHQQVIGISAMKGNFDLKKQVSQLLNDSHKNNFEILHDYHLGGFGKHPLQLIAFINETYVKHHIPLDIVYTGKVFFAVKDLITKGFFKHKSKLLIIHSGGLQGNRSLGDKVLTF